MKNKMKKIISLLAVFLLLVPFLPSASAEWHWYPVEDGIVSYVDGGTYWLSLDEETLTEYLSRGWGSGKPAGGIGV